MPRGSSAEQAVRLVSREAAEPENDAEMGSKSVARVWALLMEKIYFGQN